MKKYKVKTGKQLLKMIVRGKITNQFIVEKFTETDIVGFYIGTEHYSTGRSMSLMELLEFNNTFYIYKNTEENYQMIEPLVRKYNEYFMW